MSGSQEQQMKYCEEVINKIFAHPKSEDFHVPVDPVAYNIPDYFDKIKNPMDLGTIRTKLQNQEYPTVDDFKADYMLMINNCYTYNAKSTRVYKNAQEIEKQFKSLMAKGPFENEAKKRKIETASPKLPKIPRTKGSMSLDDQKFCLEILDEIMKTKNQDIFWPFVDPITDECVPNYSMIIKNPTDLTTIRSKVNDRMYESREDFYKELKLMVSNCHKFNDNVKKIYDCGTELDKLIDSIFKREKSTEEEIKARISEIKTQILALHSEQAIFEEKLAEEERSKITPAFAQYTLEERLKIVGEVSKLSECETCNVAKIIISLGAPVSIVGYNEVEVDVRDLSDACIAQILNYIQRVKTEKLTAEAETVQTS